MTWKYIGIKNGFDLVQATQLSDERIPHKLAALKLLNCRFSQHSAANSQICFGFAFAGANRDEKDNNDDNKDNNNSKDNNNDDNKDNNNRNNSRTQQNATKFGKKW